MDLQDSLPMHIAELFLFPGEELANKKSILSKLTRETRTQPRTSPRYERDLATAPAPTSVNLTWLSYYRCMGRHQSISHRPLLML